LQCYAILYSAQRAVCGARHEASVHDHDGAGAGAWAWPWAWAVVSSVVSHRRFQAVLGAAREHMSPYLGR
jgi:hypothetical protein